MSDPIPTSDPNAERLAGLLVRFNELAQQVPSAQSSKACMKIRQNMHNTKFAIRSLCNRNGLAVPELQEIPPNPFSEVPPPAAPIVKKPAPEPALPDTPAAVPTEPEPSQADVYPHYADPLPEKAGPGPYLEPTTEQIIQAAEAHRAALGLSTADMDFRDHNQRAHANLVQGLATLLESQGAIPSWMRQVQDELARARAKFPCADHLTLAMAEESGEVVKAMLDLRAGKGTLQELHAEIIQTMAMCVRLLEEGDPAVLGEAVA